MGASMKYFKIIALSIIMLSFSFADHGRKKHKKKKHRKSHPVRVVHKHPKLKISLGYNYFWRNWNMGYHSYKKYHSDDVIIINKEINKSDSIDDVDTIISYIERLSELNKNGIITDKEFEKKKKDLLKKI